MHYDYIAIAGSIIAAVILFHLHRFFRFRISRIERIKELYWNYYRNETRTNDSIENWLMDKINFIFFDELSGNKLRSSMVIMNLYNLKYFKNGIIANYGVDEMEIEILLMDIEDEYKIKLSNSNFTHKTKICDLANLIKAAQQGDAPERFAPGDR